RVAIARALVHKPRIFLADEPTGNLDPDTSWGIVQLLLQINHRGTTVVMATHNREVVDLVRRRVIAIEGGRVVRDEQEGQYLKDGVSLASIENLRRHLAADSRVSGVHFESKDDAAREAAAQKELGDSLKVLGSNPLPASLNLDLRRLGDLPAIDRMVRLNAV